MLNPLLNGAGLKFSLEDDFSLNTKIKVIGVGGGGSNAVARMMDSGLTGVEFYVLNTDKQALQASPVPNKLAIGSKITNGLGAGADVGVKPAGSRPPARPRASSYDRRRGRATPKSRTVKRGSKKALEGRARTEK